MQGRNLSGRPALAFAALATATVVAFGLPGPPASAATAWWVDGSDPRCPYSGTGSASAPFCTIGAAAAVAAPGDSVLVRSGTYPEEVKPKNSGTQSAPISYSPAPGATVTVAGGAHGFTVDTKSWIAISGFTVSGTTGYGIYLKNSANITLSANRVTQSGQPLNGLTAPGIFLTGTTSSLIVGNTSDHNTDSGIYLSTGTTGVEVRGNLSYANARQYTRAAPGIDIRSPGNVIDRNTSYGNEDSGIQLYNGANGSVVFDNLSYGNGDHGIDCLNSTGVVIVSNTVYSNHTAGINLEGAVGTAASTGGTVRNNVSVDNGLTSTTTRGDIRVDPSSTTGTTIDSDLFWLTSPGVLVTWGATLYSSMSALQSGTGQESHGIQADPSWVNPAAANFHLTAGSPAIDSADSGAPSQPTTDLQGNPRVDDPATPNTGLGQRSYDDRGAFEFQPDFPPAATLALSPGSGVAPLAVTADASGSTDTDAWPIASYSFNFGDGTVTGPQAGPTATHTFTSPGRYLVTVTVTDTAGKTGSATATEVVGSADGSPVAVLSLASTSGPAPLNETADASASFSPNGTALASYQFDFGDGTGATVGTSPTATHTYTSVGTYRVTVTVTDALGRTGTAATATVTVQAPDVAPVAALSVSPQSGAAPLPVTADASASTDTDAWPIATYTFDFGDGTVVGPKAAATAAHTYSGAGTFTVTVTVTDTAGLASTATATVTVSPQNLAGNPGFETNTTGWNNNGRTGITLTRTAGGHTGSYAAVLANTTTSTQSDCTLNDSPNWVTTTKAGTYVASLWVRADTPGAMLRLRLREYAGSTFAGQVIGTVVLSTDWQQVTVSYVPTAPGGSTLDLTAYTLSASPGTCFWADDASIMLS